jgi:hypothetical protein
MNFDQYRLQPLPPQKKPIWKRITFALAAFLLVSLFVFFFSHPDIGCRMIGGEWHYLANRGEQLGHCRNYYPDRGKPCKDYGTVLEIA